MMSESIAVFNSVLRVRAGNKCYIAEAAWRNENSINIIADAFEVFDDSIEFYSCEKEDVSDGLSIIKRRLVAHLKKELFEAIFIECEMVKSSRGGD